MYQEHLGLSLKQLSHTNDIVQYIYSILILYRFPVPDLREGVNVAMCNQPKLRQELCYADVSSLMFKTCLDDSKLTKYELQLNTLKGK